MRIPTGKPGAIACIADEAGHVGGTVKFYSMSCGVFLVADIFGLPHEAAFLDFHIHEGSHCAGDDFSAVGGHYDSDHRPHPLHDGDLPPLPVYGGRALLALWNGHLTLPQIVGRTVIIHSGADDFRTQPAGMSGSRLACGEIHRV